MFCSMRSGGKCQRGISLEVYTSPVIPEALEVLYLTDVRIAAGSQLLSDIESIYREAPTMQGAGFINLIFIETSES